MRNSRKIILKDIVRKLILRRIRNRLKIVTSYYKNVWILGFKWIFSRTENDNFYYDISRKNELDLVSILAVVLNEREETISKYIEEIKTDKEVFQVISDSWSADPLMKDAKVGLGRRIGWYAIVRAKKPSIVLETGVSHGVGALVLCAALERNSKEGFPGNYLGTDINSEAGSILPTKYKGMAKILIGDSLHSLRKLNSKIDIFINDSDHSSYYEKTEYEVINTLLTDDSIILGDNSHVTEELRNFSKKNGRRYIFFKEEPASHWYPGAGIGISFI